MQEGVMKRLYRILLYVGVIVFFSSGMGVAGSKGWELDKAHSNFYFTVDHIFSQIRGQFNEFSGEVNFDPDNLAESRFYFEIETESVNTNIAKRDKHLQSADFFDASKYPKMTFVSESITKAGDDVYEVAGKFTVKGEVHDLILPLKLVGVKPHPAAKGKDVAGFNGTVTIDRLAHNVGTGKFYEMGVVGKDVEIYVSLEVLSEQ